jgi:hypothetical protein
MRRPGGDQTTAVPAALSAPPTIHIISADSGRANRAGDVSATGAVNLPADYESQLELDGDGVGIAHPEPLKPGGKQAGTSRFERLFLNEFLENLVNDTIDWFVKAGAAVYKEKSIPKRVSPVMSVWTSEVSVGVNKCHARLLYLTNKELTEYSSGHWRPSSNVNCDALDDRLTCLRSRTQYLYLVVSERSEYIKVGVTGLSEVELVRRYTNYWGRVSYHIYAPIKNGKEG